MMQTVQNSREQIPDSLDSILMDFQPQLPETDLYPEMIPIGLT